MPLGMALEAVDRRLFIPNEYLKLAPYDVPIPLGPGQALPSRAAAELFIGLLDVKPNDKVLEIGTGSGYEAAILSQMCAEVHTVEVREVPDYVKDLLPENVMIHQFQDGRYGLPWEGHFDAILVTCGVPHVEAAWYCQLAEGGRLVVPIGNRTKQRLVKFVREGDRLHDMGDFAYVRCVPAVGKPD
jgi:protein-L-isoaspartate(D-aspartate) O-methyltransferase